jgi:cytochrome c oxidase subunit 1
MRCVIGMVYAVVGISIVSWLVWAHHMYVSGYMGAATMIIGVPTAVKVYS